MKKASAPDVDYGSLAEFLSALAYPARLELLRILRVPHVTSEIKLSPLRVEPGENRDRTASKQTIQAHLDKLVDADLVRVEDTGPGARKSHLYSVNSQKVYAVTEDLRRLSTLYAGSGGVGEFTGTMGVPSLSGSTGKGANLVLVHGLYEGKVYELGNKAAREDGWVIGRRRDVAIPLDYDPYVSLENSVVRREGDAFVIEDLGSKNGTAVNWQPLAKGKPRALKSADVVCVGRSSLVFGVA